MLITVSLIEDRFETAEQRAEREAICRTFLENLNRRIEMPQGNAIAVINAGGKDTQFVGQEVDRRTLGKRT